MKHADLLHLFPKVNYIFHKYYLTIHLSCAHIDLYFNCLFVKLINLQYSLNAEYVNLPVLRTRKFWCVHKLQVRRINVQLWRQLVDEHFASIVSFVYQYVYPLESNWLQRYIMGFIVAGTLSRCRKNFRRFFYIFSQFERSG